MAGQYRWPTNPRRHERAQDLQLEREEQGHFRCDRCNLLKPLPAKIEDGHRHCRRCEDPLFPSEASRLLGEQKAQASINPITFLQWPVVGAFNGDPAITAISPASIFIAKSGGTGTVNITGVNLSATDTWSASGGGVTVTPTVNSSTSVTLAIGILGPGTAGDYNLVYNGDTLTPRGIFKVR